MKENIIQAHSIILGGSKSKQHNYNTRHAKHPRLHIYLLRFLRLYLHPNNRVKLISEMVDNPLSRF